MKKICYVLSLIVIVVASSMRVSAQERAGNGYNSDALRPVHESYKMFKKTVWRRIDLEEKQNLPFFSRNGELSTIIINAVKAGLLFPYTNDSVNTRMSKETFLENLKLEEEGGGLTEEEIAMGFGADSDDDFFGGGFEEGGEKQEEEILDVNEFSPRDFSIAELKEEMYFDRMRSRMYFDMIAITIFLPADRNPAMFEKPLASFKYKDLTALFRSMPEEAIWYNAYNTAEHKNMADAFDLRLFSSNLTKLSNPKDERLVDIYNKTRRDGIIASQQIEYDLVDFENELWEF
ncbi:gliding motility protein GldN [Reichenbachiella agarivorans]|uniref:Gliding motility protein GldN n=1 Tax=Reichenbachiella agarivorans TaxID=2979464 RepID=A0ABY6CTA9_9BACT|nr:gliding motility protein GldN [Reichenbachiella agarivorans]UXP33759.1 gliding motility protein GldN [Reichenbachiella agarivorans]